MTATNDGAAAVSPLGAGAAALRRFWRPFVLIQGAAALLAVAYRVSASFRAACTVAAAWSTARGLPLAAATSAVAGGILPEIAKLVADRGRSPLRGRGGEIAFNTAFFAFNGVVIDLLYRGEARLFGGDARALTVIEKVAFDQFVFSPQWLIFIVLLFLWRQRDYSLAATLPVLRPGFYRHASSRCSSRTGCSGSHGVDHLRAAGAASVSAVRSGARRLESDHGLHRRPLIAGPTADRWAPTAGRRRRLVPVGRPSTGSAFTAR